MCGIIYNNGGFYIMRESRPIEIEIKEDSSGLRRETYRHPAFGMVSFRRITGGDNVLFGSSIKHNDRIQLTIKHGEQDRTLHEDGYYGRKRIVEVEMSYSQFAECIGAMNVGDGVPGTIQYTEKDGRMPALEENNSKREQFRNEFSDTCLLYTSMEQQKCGEKNYLTIHINLMINQIILQSLKSKIF